MATPFTNFIQGNPDRLDFLERGSQQYDSRKKRYSEKGWTTAFKDLGSSVGSNLGSYGGTGMGLGLSTLNEILFNQGKTDPAAFNRDLLANSRNTEAQQQAVRGSAASRGLQNSGANNAIEAAVGAAGADREGAMRANETQLAEQRKRDDLMLMLQLIINPSLTGSGIAAGSEAQFAQMNQQNKGAEIGGLASILASIFGNFGGKK